MRSSMACAIGSGSPRNGLQSPGGSSMILASGISEAVCSISAVLVATEARALYERKGDVVSSRKARTFIEDRVGPGTG